MSARAARPSGWRGRSRESGRDDWDLRENLETLALGGLAEALVEATAPGTGSSAIGPQGGRAELQSVRRAERMQQKHAAGRLANLMARMNRGPLSRQARRGLSGLVLLGAREDVVASSPREGRKAFDRCRPPDSDGYVLLNHLPHEGTRRLSHAQRDHRRGVPELHRPLSRSSSRAFSTAPVGSAGRGIFQKPFGSFPEPSRMSPARAFSSRWAGISAAARSRGTILAIGFPRSVTITSSPALTRARYSLRLALSLATGALFMNGLL